MLVRTLTFCKNLTHTQSHDKPSHEEPWWVLIGHPDELEVSPCRQMTLEDIQQVNDATYKRDSADFYHHTIFLIDSENTAGHQESDQSLWRPSNQFLSITRIHYSNATDLQAQFDALTEYFSCLSQEKAFSGISWRIYYTLELSDMVLISCSRSLQMLSHWSLNATKTPLAGSAYTYFCIPGFYIENSSVSWAQDLTSDILDFLSIRFSVKGGTETNNLLNRAAGFLGENGNLPIFRIAGNEDAIICGQNIPTTNLIKLYQSWYNNTSEVMDSFRGIITRLGTNWQRTPPPLDILNASSPTKEKEQEKGAQEKLVKCCKALAEEVEKAALGKDQLQEKEWLRPLVTITNTLVHMSKTATLDEAALLILPGIKAFWENILHNGEDNTDEPLYSRFAELCINTMEHLMRAEGQLSNRPEMRPLTYDLPVFVLEYAAAFLMSLRQTLTAADSPPQNICFLLVPSSEGDVATEELFEATQDPNIPGLIQITVPFSLLYTPSKLLPALCHEMAHFVGEKLRQRKFRYKCFLQSVAAEIIYYFFDKVDDPDNQFQDYLANEFLDKRLRNWLIKNTPFDENNGDEITELPLSELTALISLQVDEFISGTAKHHIVKGSFPTDPGEFDAGAALIREYITSSYRGARLCARSKESLMDRKFRFINAEYDLLTLFREAYADICMLFLLDLSPEEYLNVTVKDIPNDFSTGVLLRAYVSLHTAKHSSMEIIGAFETFGRAKGKGGAVRDEIQRQLKKLQQHISTETYSPEYQLQEYLKHCWKSFEDNKLGDPLQDTHYSVRELYRKLRETDTVQYPEILAIIDDGRKAALHIASHSDNHAVS